MFVDTVRLALSNGQMLLHAAKLPYLISRRPILTKHMQHTPCRAFKQP